MRPQVLGDNDQGYESPPQPPGDYHPEFSDATPEDNSHIVHTYLELVDMKKIPRGQDIAQKYEMTIPDMQERPPITSDNDQKCEHPSQSPVKQDQMYNNATTEKNDETTDVKQLYELPSKPFGDQSLEYTYTTPDREPSYQNLSGTNGGRLYQNLRVERL